MVNLIGSRVGTKYTEWLGTVAADNRPPGPELLGIDTHRWMVVLMRISFDDGRQRIRAWGIEHGCWEHYQSMAASGRIPVTRLLDLRQHPPLDVRQHSPLEVRQRPARQSVFNAPTMPVTSATDLLTSTFKQLEMRLEWTCYGTRPGEKYEFIEVGSIV